MWFYRIVINENFSLNDLETLTYMRLMSERFDKAQITDAFTTLGTQWKLSKGATLVSFPSKDLELTLRC